MARYPIVEQSDVPDVETLVELLAEGGRALPPASDRDAWRAVAERPGVRERLPELRRRAEEAAREEPLLVAATDYLSYFRTGSRQAHRSVAQSRPSRLALLTAVECLEHEGRFMDALLDLSWAMAEETSWVMPAHLNHAGDEPLPDVANPHIDLRVAMVARVLAEMLHVLREEMEEVSPLWVRRVQHELQRQAVGPYLAQKFHWEGYTFNWNAVCTDGVLVAALLGEFDRETKARALAKALRSAPPFLSGFTDDGGCSEGPGYWGYGMSHYTSMCYHVHRATGGAVDLLAHPNMRYILEYPTKVILTDDIVVNFADAPATARFGIGTVAWAAEQAGAEDTLALAASSGFRRGMPSSVLDVYLRPEPRDFEPPALSVLPDLELLVARADTAAEEPLTLAVKGGHNREAHNHNDVGNFILHRGGTSLICDLGRGEYVKEFFGPKRYEFLTTRSLGHNLPLLNGVEQGAGGEFSASGFEKLEEGATVGVSMDIASAYPAEARVGELRRRIVLDRRTAAVELTDEVEFEDGPGIYELPLYGEGAFRHAGPGSAVVAGPDGSLRIEWDPDLLDARLEQVHHEDAALQRRFGPVLRRLRLSLKGPMADATVRLRFVPRA